MSIILRGPLPSSPEDRVLLRKVLRERDPHYAFDQASPAFRSVSYVPDKEQELSLYRAAAIRARKGAR